jgi:hypothetical protein
MYMHAFNRTHLTFVSFVSLADVAKGEDGDDLSSIALATEEVCFVVKLFGLASSVTVGYKPFRLMPWCFHSRFTATQDAGALHKTTVSFVL